MTNRRISLSPARIRHLANMRAAKGRKRTERIAAGWTPEPRHIRAPRWLEIAFRDSRSGDETGWQIVRSAREAARWANILQKQWQP